MSKFPKIKGFAVILLMVLASHSLCFATGPSSRHRNSILFIHHSVGENLINRGSLRQLFKMAGYELWDHGYNHPESGLKDPNGENAGCYWIPGDNTDPSGLANLFSKHSSKDSSLSSILKNHDIIIFKSCFSASKLHEDDPVKDMENKNRKSVFNYKRHYQTILDTIKTKPDKKFIIFSPPPLHPAATNESETLRVKTFVNWLKTEIDQQASANVYLFDYFGLLSDPNSGALRKEFQELSNTNNSHPNAIADLLIGPQLVDFVVNIASGAEKAKHYEGLDHIRFNSSQWPYDLTRLQEPAVAIKGSALTQGTIATLYWTDLKRENVYLSPEKDWTISDLNVPNGVTKIFVIGTTANHLRFSSAMALQYYSGADYEIDVYDESLKKYTLGGLQPSNQLPFSGKNHLIVKGNGKHRYAVIKNMGIDISDLDPKRTSISFYYDQGNSRIKPKLYLADIGSWVLDADSTVGYQKIVVSFNNFQYFTNRLDKMAIAGKWENGTDIFLDAIKLSCQ